MEVMWTISQSTRTPIDKITFEQIQEYINSKAFNGFPVMQEGQTLSSGAERVIVDYLGRNEMSGGHAEVIITHLSQNKMLTGNILAAFVTASSRSNAVEDKSLVKVVRLARKHQSRLINQKFIDTVHEVIDKVEYEFEAGIYIQLLALVKRPEALERFGKAYRDGRMRFAKAYRKVADREFGTDPNIARIVLENLKDGGGSNSINFLVTHQWRYTGRKGDIRMPSFRVVLETMANPKNKSAIEMLNGIVYSFPHAPKDVFNALTTGFASSGKGSKYRLEVLKTIEGITSYNLPYADTMSKAAKRDWAVKIGEWTSANATGLSPRERKISAQISKNLESILR